ncbi:MipA/OmpV family protein [Aurantiacibacter flavus]|uniref:MipA/OmpV family protein n=1 Tax=Aurantiacibacter flavus TaxID=3145232 RepID=A0ABV0D123_9SPHN
MFSNSFKAGSLKASLALAAATLMSAGASAQDSDEQIDMSDTAFSGDYLSVGVGVAVNPSYLGSDDYVFTPLPIVQGSLGGVGISPRGGGLALDFIPDGDGKIGFDLGVAARLRANRNTQIKDEVVASLGKLDKAIEVGPTAGVTINKVLHGYDSLTFSADAVWDINGAHDGFVVSPSVTYFTPLNRGMVASLSLSTEYADAKFHDYYFAVSPAQSVATGGELPEFQPSGGGFTRAGATLLTGIDLDGDITNGGFGLIVVGGYSRVLGDAADTPFTSVRGSKDQFFGAFGVGYTF